MKTNLKCVKEPPLWKKKKRVTQLLALSSMLKNCSANVRTEVFNYCINNRGSHPKQVSIRANLNAQMNF